MMIRSMAWHKLLILSLLVWFVFFLKITPAVANPAAVSWLQGVANQDGSYSLSTDIATPFQATSEVINAFDLTSTATDLTPAILFLNNDPYLGCEYLSRKIIAGTIAGSDVSTLVTTLVTLQNADGGFGELPGYDSTALDTSFALLALDKAGYTNAATINDAIYFLSQQQQADGGFPLKQPNESAVYDTAMVSMALQNYLFTYNVGNLIQQASDFILSKKITGSGWSSDWETAIALMALLPVTTDASLYNSAVTVLTNNQAIDGSWSGDVYITALATQALYLVANVQLPVEPTSGILTARIIDTDTNVPLSGVSVTATAVGSTTPLEATTGADGTVRLENVPPDDYEIVYSINGYSGATQTATVQVGQIVDLGTIRLTALPNTAIMQGVVTDIETGVAIAGADVSVSGSTNLSVQTDAAGQYRIILVPGAITVTAAATGYRAISGTANVVAGQTVAFSPALTPETSDVKDPAVTLSGVVQEADTNAPIANAQVVVNGVTTYQTSTDASGHFSLTNIEAAELTISISAADYTNTDRSLVATPSSAIDLGVIYMQPVQAPVTTTVTGVVVDVDTGAPIGGATVSVEGVNLSAITASDGFYAINAIDQADFSLLTSATGYLSSFSSISLLEPKTINIDFSLKAASVAGIAIDSLDTDSATYGAYQNAQLSASVKNNGSDSQTIKLMLEVLDDTDQLIQRLMIAGSNITGAQDESYILLPGNILDVTSNWYTAATMPGNYKISLKVYDKYTNKLLAERIITRALTATQYIQELKLKSTPQYAKVGEISQVNLTAGIINQSNIDNTVMLYYEMSTPGGVVVQTGNATLDIKTEDVTKTYSIDSYPYTFDESGEYHFNLQVLSGVQPAAIITYPITVAPSVRVEVEQAISPTTVVPDGDKRIRINIQLKGVESK